MEIPTSTTTETELKRHALRSLVWLFVALILAYAFASLLMLANSARYALRAKDDALALVGALQQQRLDLAMPIISRLQVEVDQAQFWRKPAFWLAATPVVRHDYLFYADVLNASEGFLYSGDSVLKETISASADNTSLSAIDVKKIPTALLSVQPELQQSLNDLQQALSRSEHVHVSLLPAPYQEQIHKILDLSANLQAVIEEFSPFIKNLPVLLGQDQPHDIVILLENPHELRPTGGFLGTYGRITFDKGQITNFFTDDIYNVDVKALGHETLIAPEPLQRYVGVKYWYLRDANWSPDFPTSAKNMLSLYEFESGEQGIDTLVAMTPRLVEEFLRLTGPVEVDGLTFTSENLIDTLQNRVEQEFWRIGLKDEERKKVINDLAQVLRDRFFSLNADQAKAFAEVFRKTLDQSEILVYTNIIDVEKELVNAGWAGEIQQPVSDYLFVVDANLGALKTDRLMDKSVDYSVAQQSDGSWKATLKLTYKNNGFFDYRTTRYRSYTRVYIPLGSDLVSVDGLMSGDKSAANAKPDVYTEFHKMVVAGFISVEPGQQRSVTYTYTLPSTLAKHFEDQQRYELFVQKQAGTNRKMNGSVSSQAPLFSFAPSTIDYHLTKPQTLQFSDHLDQNRLYTLRFRP